MTALTFFHIFVGNEKRYPGKVQKCGDWYKGYRGRKIPWFISSFIVLVWTSPGPFL
jgi:hypothetical protein